MKLSNARKIIPGYFEISLLTIFIKGSKKKYFTKLNV